MTQIFDEKGEVIPVTIIKGGPCYITQIKSTENSGYDAVQIGYTEIASDSKHLTKPRLGHFNKVNLPPFRYLKEYRTNNFSEYKIGQKVGLEMFKVGQNVHITGFTIGKGFASNFKRNNFTTGLMTHGSKSHRLQGSIGAGTTPSRVYKGKKMAGRKGMDNILVANLKVIKKDADYLFVKGAVPGKKGTLIEVIGA